MDQVKFVEDSLLKIWSVGPFLNTLPQMGVSGRMGQYLGLSDQIRAKNSFFSLCWFLFHEVY